jgi:exosortase A
MNMMGRVEPPVMAPAPVAVLPPDRWHSALVALALGLLALGVLFFEEAAAAVRLWNASTAYNHCWLVAPIAAWLFWQRRHRLDQLAPDPLPAAALLALPGALAWLAAERLGIMEGRQLVLMGLVWVLVLAVFGWRFSAAFAAPLIYLIFLVPFGGFAVGPLQAITARLIDWGLDLVGITHFVDGLLIETPAGTFHVAEACAGLRFIIAALAFGALYAFVIFRSPWRRLLVMALALAVPVLANGVRAGGIIVLAEYWGSAEAAAADHVIYGWGFFSAVILLLVLAGLPFREDFGPPPPLRDAPPPRPLRTGRLALAAGLALALTATGPAVAAGLAYNSSAPVARPVPLAAPGCTQAADGALLCGGLRITAERYEFSARVNWGAVSRVRWDVAGGADTELTFTLPLSGGGGAWQARENARAGTASAFAIWLDGRPTGGGVASRLAQARNSLGVGEGGRPVLVVVRARPMEGAAPAAGRVRAVLADVLAAQRDGLLAEAAAASRAR